ncbi:hypothetical protein PGB90_007449 [Kerria lacca]
MFWKKGHCGTPIAGGSSDRWVTGLADTVDPDRISEALVRPAAPRWTREDLAIIWDTMLAC